MDFTAIGAITTSLSTSLDIARGLVGLRDLTLISEKTAALTEQLLQAQQALLAHNAALLQLQHQHFETREEVRKLHETLRERGRYSLFEVGNGQFAYRVNIPPQEGGPGEPTCAEPLHYLCQPCFDKDIKAVLQRRISSGIATNEWECPSCRHTLLFS